ncbi:hypothetical protein NUW58_g2748 [Xylaria curta]|uniref:Uncharacterized protein n=1 Tax=Xylaria curta TaxID=42375 RepID=A0ACC1PGS1_9PEZI|nr:hypothetical protein NUW58_g2748 [Xylaria curta]
MEEAAAPSKSSLKKAAKMAGKAEKKEKQVPVVGGKKDDSKEIIGITASKDSNFSLWYQELVVKGEMVEYYNEISGFYILRPAAMYTWNIIRKWFQERIEAMGVEETSFPMFLSSKSLEKEKDHVEGFAPELAWVTKAAHLNEESASKEVLEILEHYAGVYEQLLAVPVVRGKKTEAEKFAGGAWTTTVEGYIPANGRGIQGATSHCLGQNFSKMFDVTVEDPDKKGEKINVWQNSWGLSTRVIGVMCMLHGDDKGLVMPPRVARLQTILIPVGITNKMSAEDKASHAKKVEDLYETLKKAVLSYFATNDISALRDSNSLNGNSRGVPLRIEFGPKDAANNVVSYARRDSGEKGTIPVADIAIKVPELLETIQKSLYDKADAAFSSHRLVLTDWSKVVPALDSKNVVLIPFCEAPACEERIKEITKSEEPKEGAQNEKQPTMGMKSLCIPFEQPEGLTPETKCLNPECSALAKSWTMFGRSY